MKSKKKSNIVFLITIPSVILMVVLFEIIFNVIDVTSYHPHHYTSSDVQLSFFAAFFSLLNSIPFFLRIYKKKSTISFSLVSLCINCYTGFISLLSLSYNFYQNNIKTEPLEYSILRWIPDIFAACISWFAAIYVLSIKIKNIKQNKKEKIIFEKTTRYFTLLIFIILVVVFLFTLTIIYHFYTKYKNETILDHIFFYLRLISSLLGFVSTAFLISRIYLTKNTYSISILSKYSLLTGYVLWLILDIITYNITKKDYDLIIIVSDIVGMLLIAYIVIYKMYNIHKYKNTEQELNPVVKNVVIKKYD